MAIPFVRFKQFLRPRYCIVLFVLVSIVYVASFFEFRRGFYIDGLPKSYLFSNDPDENRNWMTAYRPMIWISGGQMETDWRNKSPYEQIVSAHTPLYLTEFSIDAWPAFWFD